jgi:hypothetical protein
MRLRDRVTVLRSVPVTGPYGTQEPDWTVPAQVIYPAEVQPIVKPSDEALVNQDRTKTILRAFLPAMVDLQATDRVVWAGLTYEVDGEPKHWYRAGRPHHVQVLLVRTVGG